MKVAELRDIMEDCWFRITVCGNEPEDDVILFDQNKQYLAGKSPMIPDNIAEMEVDWACVTDMNDIGDSCLFVAVKRKGE